MRRHLVPVLLLTVALSGGTASADPIRITGGSLEMTGPTGVVALTGTRGFTLSARVSVFDGTFAPWESCRFVPTCVPGASIGLTGQFAGLGVPGTATLDGQAFSHLGSLESDDHAVLRLAGSAIAPLFTGDTAILLAPFTFDGTFLTRDELNRLTGHGTAALLLRKAFGPSEGLVPAWEFVSARYQFDPAPEPATLVTIGTGLAWLGIRRRRTRQSLSRATRGFQRRTPADGRLSQASAARGGIGPERS